MPASGSRSLTIGGMRVLVVSTYELGHQPMGAAAAAAELVAAGHEVSVVDLAVDDWDAASLTDVDAVAVSVPMHTALRLAIETGKRIKQSDPGLPVAFYGLYAGVGEEGTLGVVADRLIAGEYEEDLVAWVDSVAGTRPHRGSTVSVHQRRFRTPLRIGLPALDNYAHLAVDGEHRLVGYVEASRGCRHRCTHCPIPVLYDGRYRITGVETVLADVAQQVHQGAAHITFGDPDFLNAPAYALKTLETVHSAFPNLTFDVTVKVSHLLEHADRLGAMADAGVLFVVSAMESLDPEILARLDKRHTAAEAARSVRLVRDAGMDIHPTWLPFTPWTTPDTVADIARFVWDHDLAPVTDPVQLSIRLLIPDGSLMLDVGDLAPHLIGYDPQQLGYMWRAADPEMDQLAARLQTMAEQGAVRGEEPLFTLAEMTAEIGRAADVDIPTVAIPAGAVEGRPRMTEPWFC